jgi:predicted PurR-regulated permease PerM
MMKLSPLEDEYERELLDKFANISRAVVVASLASAAAQGLLAGLGYSFALDKDAPIFLLTMLTMVFAIVPFAGAAAVWVPTALWIYLFQPVYENGQAVVDAATGQPLRGDTFTAVALAVYGVCIVSAIDNVIKPLVLHGQSNLHPLVALISILGGVQTLGPIGILVGPMLVAFIQALMNMINKELLRLGDGTIHAPLTPAVAVPLGPAPIAEAEAAASSTPVAAPGDSPEAPRVLRGKRRRRQK